MPPDKESPSLPPGISGEELLRHMLPLVVSAVTKSAEGQTMSASAIQNLEGQVAELKAAVQANTSEVKRVNDYRKAELQQRDDDKKWLQSLLRPETLYYTLLLIGTALGIRATIPAPVQVPLPVSGQHTTLPGDRP